MRRSTVTILSLLVASAVSYAQNPISPEGVYIADPTARVDRDGTMYVYGSLDVSPRGYCSERYHVLFSKDLKSWTLKKDSFVNDKTLFAPDMIRKDDTYYLYYDIPTGEEFVAVSDSPVGPFKDGVRIEGPMGIDPNIFVDDDGQAYYFWGQFAAKGAKMNPDMKTIDMSTMVDSLVTEEKHHFHEGSFVFKRGKYYYFTYADIGRQGRPTCIGYAMATSPFGPYEYKGVIVDSDACDRAVWNNHGSIVEYDGKWYVLYHRSTGGTNTMRKACIEPISFREDGTICEVEMTSQGAAGPLDAYSGIAARRMCILSGHACVKLEEGRTDHEILTSIENGDMVAYKYLDFGKKTPERFTARVRGTGGARIGVTFDQRYLGSSCTLELPASKGDWMEISCEIPPEAKHQGVHAIWLSFAVPESGFLDVDWFRFD